MTPGSLPRFAGRLLFICGQNPGEELLKDAIKKLWRFCTTPEMISYLVFGVLTTVVNIAVFSVCHDSLQWSWEVSNLLAWLLAVIFAFFTNKLFVFRSKSFAMKLFLFELVSFFGARLLSLGVDMAGMWLCLDVIQMHSLLAKIIVNFFVILINYILSKLIIFSKKHEPNHGG
ncbi:MAG TPA: GtrA family protein [Candidatus Caccousia stercoris]|uniref:GtrA family protein n=1 Tax=Candidatus Caccousia stercoris TaxID=2840723 RepID=A0A9D1K2P4_9FIRM|nr:hypothetical protein B5F35_10045 [Anaeromassilibacillus sp. An200]HIS78353.1 GtrA family protein [Candidatus Caccousia stercoris]